MAKAFPLGAFAYAHRGLWNPEAVPENTAAAFIAAREAGLGIEFDLRPSADGAVMVFHDATLDRMTGAAGRVDAMPRAALAALAQKQTAEGIITLDELLGLWPEHLPLLAEMKIDGATDAAVFAGRVGARLADWPGFAAAMSFSETAVRALPAGLMRGQLVEPSQLIGPAGFETITRRAVADGIDYLALHHTDADKGERDLPRVVWTVRTPAVLASAKASGAALIFEHLDLSGIRPAAPYIASHGH
jgi:glycerophosphoryl diester phosphodiesterase